MSARKMVKARAKKCARMAKKYREMRQFGAACRKYGELFGICCALAEWGSRSEGEWFDLFKKGMVA